MRAIETEIANVACQKTRARERDDGAAMAGADCLVETRLSMPAAEEKDWMHCVREGLGKETAGGGAGS